MSLEQCSIWLADLLVFQFATFFQAGFLWAIFSGLLVWCFQLLGAAFMESPWGTAYRRSMRLTFRSWRKREAEGVNP